MVVETAARGDGKTMNEVKRASRTTGIKLSAGLLVAAIVLGGVGCETLTSTTLEENEGAYYEAREFLSVGHTTASDVQAKYGRPAKRETLADGNDYWLYRKTEMVVMNAYTNTPFGTEGGIIGGFGGYEHTIDRVTTMELFFTPEGTLVHYRINRGVK